MEQYIVHPIDGKTFSLALPGADGCSYLLLGSEMALLVENEPDQNGLCRKVQAHLDLPVARAHSSFEAASSLDLGSRKVECVLSHEGTPVVYEPERQYLYTGDFLYPECTVDCSHADPNAVKARVDKLSHLPVQRVLSSKESSMSHDFVQTVSKAMSWLDRHNLLHAGQGCYAFNGFQIEM
jgi:hypothetical protein